MGAAVNNKPKTANDIKIVKAKVSTENKNAMPPPKTIKDMRAQLGKIGRF